MNRNNSTLPLPFSHYIYSFFAIQILWMVGGNYLTGQLYYLSSSSVFAISPILMYVIQHANFFLLLILLIIFIKVVHKTSILSFITDHKRFNIKGLFLGLGVWLGAMIINSGLNIVLLQQRVIIPHSDDFSIHILMVLVALLCSPVQAFSEEVLFRSFFYNAFKQKAVNKYIISSIAALFFTLAHLSNSELTLFNSPFLILLYYFLSGFFFMLIVYHYGGIEVALGAHIMNNFYITTIMNYEKSSIFSHPYFIIEKTNIYADIILLTLTSLLLLSFKATKPKDKKENDLITHT